MIGLLLASASAGVAEHGAPDPATLPRVLPFLLLLLVVAIAPLLAATWWRRWYVWVVLAFAVAGVCTEGASGGSLSAVGHALGEYGAFIALIGSLYVIAGGIFIGIRGKARPAANVALLAAGALLANLLGTTGASAALIRPYIRTNRSRIRPYHIVFFIFIVGNIGGALTPIGDPPLFLGYLRGIPFFWFLRSVWGAWMATVGLLLLTFYCVDLVSLRRRRHSDEPVSEQYHEETRFAGLLNLLFMAIVIGACFIRDIPYLREATMLAAAAGSWFTTRKEIHQRNHFSFHPIQEVAVIFFGIFLTMVPALEWLQANAASLGVETAGQFYWKTGLLSSVLDNAPTYLGFLTAAAGRFVDPGSVEWLRQQIAAHGAGGIASGSLVPQIRATSEVLLAHHANALAAGAVPVDVISTAWLLGNLPNVVAATSVAAVFFGAMTYIGNGPNFMIKAIAEHSGVRMPGFFGYIGKYSIPILLPVLTAVWWVLYRS